MPTIRDLSKSAQSLPIPQPGFVWRDEWLPANFDGFPFHVEAGGTEGGNRIVTHSFPKKDVPYSENMGRRAREWTVRGYIIVYPHDSDGGLYQRDYRVARDNLRIRLDDGSPGVLQLPTFKRDPMVVVCTRYRLSEEEKSGGYCTFDMSFVEFGARPFTPQIDPSDALFQKSYELRRQVQSVWDAEIAKAKKQVMGPFNPLVRFIGPPKKHGPIKPKPTGPESEFTSRSTSKASEAMRRYRSQSTSSQPVPGFE